MVNAKDLLKKTIKKTEQKKIEKKVYKQRIQDGLSIDFTLDAINTLDKIAGIYSITNIKSNKKYVGQSINIKKRLMSHLSELERNQHYSTKLQADYNLYGSSIFKISILEKIDPKKYDKQALNQLLIEKENKWLNTINLGHDYNVSQFKYSNLEIGDKIFDIEKRITHLEEQNQIKTKEIKNLTRMIQIILATLEKSGVNLDTILKNLENNDEFGKIQEFKKKLH